MLAARIIQNKFYETNDRHNKDKILNTIRTEQNVPHGLMFHHFYDEKHVGGQGAISAKQFENIIQYYGDKLLPADEWFNKAKTNSLNNKDVCLTFDDALLCQYDIAVPILEKYNLTAFWFVYSSVFEGAVERLEIYRKFRTVYFSDIGDFYKLFFSTLEQTEYHDVTESLNNYSHDYYKHFPFYSQNDTKFRFIRDTSLGVEKYNHLMDTIMKNYNIDLNEFSSDLWMNVEHLQRLNSNGHIVGLHSHSHPTQLSKLPVMEQEKEYHQNFKFLHAAMGKKPKTVSHPCNSYNTDTLSILHNMNIEIGFRANMESHLFSEFEYPREDHANILKRLER